jgi:hypothetical protein
MMVLDLEHGGAHESCRPSDRPEFAEIDTSETGFLIPLEGATDGQVKFESEKYLDQRKASVAAD